MMWFLLIQRLMKNLPPYSKNKQRHHGKIIEMTSVYQATVAKLDIKNEIVFKTFTKIKRCIWDYVVPCATLFHYLIVISQSLRLPLRHSILYPSSVNFTVAKISGKQSGSVIFLSIGFKVSFLFA